MQENEIINEIVINVYENNERKLVKAEKSLSLCPVYFIYFI